MGAVAKGASRSAGKVERVAGKAQHVDLYRKVSLRRRLASSIGPGAVYCPFLGEADLALQCWADRAIYGADIDSAMIEVARTRLISANLKVADCDRWPFGELAEAFAVADFDSWAYPYASFRAWWAHAAKAERVAVFFTDGQPQAIKRTSHWTDPEGHKRVCEDAGEMRRTLNFYFARVVLPWFSDLAEAGGWVVVETEKYLRAGNQLYWGAVIDRNGTEAIPPAPESNPADQVEAALLEAAVSGNVPAILAWQRANPVRSFAERYEEAMEYFR